MASHRSRLSSTRPRGSWIFFGRLKIRGISGHHIVPGEPSDLQIRFTHEAGPLRATLGRLARFESALTPAPLDLPVAR